jgi:hypothetical protein
METLATSDHAHITSLALALTAAVVTSAPRAEVLYTVQALYT